MISNERTLLIHFGRGAGNVPPAAGPAGAGELSDGDSALTDNVLFDDAQCSFWQGTHLLSWYSQWAAESCDSVYVLLPDHMRDQVDRLLPHLGKAAVCWYTDYGLSALPGGRPQKQAWLMNGNQLPVVDWPAARSVLRRRRAEVSVFGQAGVVAAHHYPESVLVGAGGEVLEFRRHYHDSPIHTDLWGDEASFLVADSEHAAAVVNHVVVHGWGLGSIGAMTRRFSVRWFPKRCVLSEVAAPIPTGTVSGVTGDLDRAANLGIPRPDGTTKATGDGLVSSQPRGQHAAAGVATRDTASGDGDSASKTSTLRPVPIAYGSQHPRLPGGWSTVRDALGGGPAEAGRIADAPGRDEPVATPTYLFWKRALDVTLSVTGLIALSPLLVVVALLIKLTSRGPVFFAHRRQGLGGREFPCLKFRTMRSGADAMQEELRALNEVDGPQFKIAADPRLTALGPLLRRTNIDELPQLFNVLAGQMSLVGPRPSPDAENQLCPPWRRARLSVKPGVTGLWQVLRMRDEEQSDFQEWIYYDVEYARYRCLWLDWKLILYTPISMIAPRWVSSFARQLERRGICRHSARLAASNGG